MKLHIECLQEKLELAIKDQKELTKKEIEVDDLKKELKSFVDLSKKVEQDAIKAQSEVSVLQKRLVVLELEKNKLILKLHEKEEVIEKLNSQIRNQQEMLHQKSLESISNNANANFGASHPMNQNMVNTGTHSAKTNLGIMSQKQKGLIFEGKKASNVSSMATKTTGKRNL